MKYNKKFMKGWVRDMEKNIKWHRTSFLIPKVYEHTVPNLEFMVVPYIYLEYDCVRIRFINQCDYSGSKLVDYEYYPWVTNKQLEEIDNYIIDTVDYCYESYCKSIA